MCVSGRTCPNECQLHIGIGITLNAGKGRIPCWYLYIFPPMKQLHFNDWRHPKIMIKVRKGLQLPNLILLVVFPFKFRFVRLDVHCCESFKLKIQAARCNSPPLSVCTLWSAKSWWDIPIHPLTLNKTEGYWAATIPSVNDLTSEPWEGG